MSPIGMCAAVYSLQYFYMYEQVAVYGVKPFNVNFNFYAASQFEFLLCRQLRMKPWNWRLFNCWRRRRHWMSGMQMHWQNLGTTRWVTALLCHWQHSGGCGFVLLQSCYSTDSCFRRDCDKINVGAWYWRWPKLSNIGWKWVLNCCFAVEERWGASVDDVAQYTITALKKGVPSLEIECLRFIFHFLPFTWWVLLSQWFLWCWRHNWSKGWAWKKLAELFLTRGGWTSCRHNLINKKKGPFKKRWVVSSYWSPLWSASYDCASSRHKSSQCPCTDCSINRIISLALHWRLLEVIFERASLCVLVYLLVSLTTRLHVGRLIV